jgi:heme A synthase
VFRKLPHALAWLALVCSYATLVTGAIETTSPQFAPRMHRVTATFTCVAIIFLFGLSNSGLRRWIAILLAAPVVSGVMREFFETGSWTGIVHAVAGSALLSGITAAVVVTSRWWAENTQRIADTGTPPVWTLGAITWTFLIAQTALGALYRHHLAGLMPHIAGAMVVVGVVMYTGIAAYTAEGAPSGVKRSALALLLAATLQMLLGVAAYVAGATVVPFRVVHVVGGGATASLAAMFSLQAWRFFRPAASAPRAVEVR